MKHEQIRTEMFDRYIGLNFCDKHLWYAPNSNGTFFPSNYWINKYH